MQTPGSEEASASSPRIIWSDDEFSIGIQILDEQHKRLVSLINEVHSMAEGKGQGASQGTAEAVSELLEDLQNYAQTHFLVEEEFMRLFHYPGYEAHRRAHSEFEGLISQMTDKLGEEGNLAELAEFLTQWLTTHVMMSDQDLGRHLTVLGIR